MVDLSDFLDPEDEEPAEGGEAEDFTALKDCLQALADAIASTNLAVMNATQGEDAAAASRVQSSLGALKRFHQAFTVLKGEGTEEA